MADNEVKVVSEAVKTLNTELQKLELQFVRGDKTVSQYTTEILKLRDAFATTKANSDLLTPGLLKVESALGKATVGLAGSNGLSKTLTEINTKLGNTRPLVTSMSQAMQDSAQFSFGAAQGIRAVANNIEMMVQQMTYLKSQGMSMGEIFTSMRSTIMGPIGILLAVSALSAGIQWLTTYFQQNSKAAKDAKKEIADYGFELDDVLYKLGLISGGGASMILARQGRISAIDTKIAQLSRPVPLISTGSKGGLYPDMMGGMVDIPSTPPVQDTATMIKNEKEIEDLYKERGKMLADIAGYQKDQTKELKDQNKELKDQNKLFLDGIRIRSEAFTRGLEDESRGVTYYGKGAGIGFNDARNILRGRKGLVDTQPELKGVNEMSGGWNIDKIVKGLDDADKKADTFTDDLKHGLIQSTQALANGFIKAFNLGDGLIAQFGANLLAAISNALAIKAATGIMDYIGLGVKAAAVIGTGGAAAPVFVGDVMGSVRNSNNMGQQGRGGAMMQPSINVVPIVNNSGLAVQVEIGDRINSRMRL